MGEKSRKEECSLLKTIVLVWKRINTQFYSANKQQIMCCYSSAPALFVIPWLCNTDDAKQYLNHV